MIDPALLQFLGRLHPMILHLPIGLWIGVATLEFGGMLIRRRAPRATIATLAWLAAIGGALAAAAGWVLALEGGYGHETLEVHRWLGVAAGGLGILAAAFAGLQARRPFQLLLLAEVGTLMAGGHFGSELTHSADWLTAPFAAPKAKPEPTPIDPAAAKGATMPTFASDVLPILEHRCGKCHGATKTKGDLALHTQAAIERGGENGPALVAGQPDDSEIVRRLLLPVADEDHMPPEGKPQPSDAEIELLRSWIATGASFTAPFAKDAAGPRGVPKAREHAPKPKDEPEAAPVEAPVKDAPAPVDVPKEPPPEAQPQQPAPTPAPTPAPAEPKPVTPGTPGGGNGDELLAPAARTAAPEPTVATPAAAAAHDAPPEPAAAAAPTSAPPEPPAADPVRDRAIAALRQRLVHVAPVARGSNGLWIDFAPIAASMSEVEARTLLAPLTAHIVDLGLARVPIGDDLMPLVGRMQQLQRLDLRKTRVTSRGLQHLRNLPDLQQLVLAETRLDAAAADTLLAMPALQRVHLWDSGIGDAAIERLQGRAGLQVDTGEAVADAALETEGPPYQVDAAAAKPTAPAPAAAAVPAALQPVNDVCPVSGKPVDARYVVVHEGRAVGFCCPNCPKPFWAEPAKFPVAAR